MPEDEFKNAKVGDRVWDSVYGWGTIAEIFLHNTYPIVVELDKAWLCHRGYTYGGRNDENEPQCLFWRELPFHIPERRKRKIKNFVA